METEALLAQFTLLGHHAADDHFFDSSKIEQLMELFEQEAYASWSSAMAQHLHEAHSADVSMKEAEDEFNSLMEVAMAEYRRTCDEADRISGEEFSGLVRAAGAAKKMGRVSKKHLKAAMASAMSKIKWSTGGAKIRPS